ncbi:MULTISPECIES: DUF5673 domain-containing protein [Terrabacteria group]|uniref:DUF5673 domain-containing protein n=1 Tax=Bacillati TaxID=1783272 RepID=UPI00193AB76A|nr:MULTISPECIES: DUF5673 domain-containing protein [Terrabacteria group]MBW9211970.1 hypothetical protein [Trueperella sp. zg.1013]QRG87225.1 hypothetical protein JOS54_02650 [Bulleidia sp. zg-1006]
MNNDTFQWAMVSVFGFLAVYMGYLNFRCASKVKIKDRQWTIIRTLVLVIALLSSLEFFAGFSVLLLIRYIVTLVACLIFFFSHDGVGNEGFVSGSYFYPYQDVKAYDVYKQAKRFTVIFIIQEENRKRKFEELTREVNFDLKNQKAVEQLLKEKIGKKYRRLKKQ